jgi:hypothetical protein
MILEGQAPSTKVRRESLEIKPSFRIVPAKKVYLAIQGLGGAYQVTAFASRSMAAAGHSRRSAGWT